MASKKKTATSAKTWKGKSTGIDLTLPSGNICHARRPGMEAMMAQGKVPNSLLPIIAEQMATAKGGKRAQDLDLTTLLGDAEKMHGVLAFQDAVIIAAVKEPRVLETPENDEDRDEDELYVDEVDAMDKAFIFQWAMGGAADLAKFRTGLAEAVLPLHTGEEVGAAAE